LSFGIDMSVLVQTVRVMLLGEGAQ